MATSSFWLCVPLLIFCTTSKPIRKVRFEFVQPDFQLVMSEGKEKGLEVDYHKHLNKSRTFY